MALGTDAPLVRRGSQPAQGRNRNREAVRRAKGAVPAVSAEATAETAATGAASTAGASKGRPKSSSKS